MDESHPPAAGPTGLVGAVWFGAQVWTYSPNSRSYSVYHYVFMLLLLKSIIPPIGDPLIHRLRSDVVLELS